MTPSSALDTGSYRARASISKRLVQELLLHCGPGLKYISETG
jgi:hypothetical protein